MVAGPVERPPSVPLGDALPMINGVIPLPPWVMLISPPPLVPVLEIEKVVLGMVSKSLTVVSAVIAIPPPLPLVLLVSIKAPAN